MTGTLLGVFLAAFLSATLLFGLSEAALFAASQSGNVSLVTLFIVATVGNVLGAVVNFLLGRFLIRFEERRWFPVTPKLRARAEALFARYGRPVLLFSFLPVVGDPVTLAAGLLRTPFAIFLVYVALGKAARYGLVLWGASFFA